MVAKVPSGKKIVNFEEKVGLKLPIYTQNLQIAYNEE